MKWRTQLNRNTYSIMALATASIAAISLATARPAAADGYTIIDLGTIPGYSDYYEWQQSINNLGHVAVYANNGNSPNAFAGDISFLWESPTQTLLLPGLPNSTDTVVQGLNDHDECVGTSNDTAGVQHAVLWKNGVIHYLGELPGDVGSASLYINIHGVAVGFSANADYSVLHALAWEDGWIDYLPPLNALDVYTECTSINDAGDIVVYPARMAITSTACFGPKEL